MRPRLHTKITTLEGNFGLCVGVACPSARPPMRATEREFWGRCRAQGPEEGAKYWQTELRLPPDKSRPKEASARHAPMEHKHAQTYRPTPTSLFFNTTGSS